MRRAAGGLVLLLLPAALAGQQVRTAVLPQDITVGDVFQVVIQVGPVITGTVIFPDSLMLPADLEPAGRRLLRQDTVAGGTRWTASYPVTGWQPGQHALPDARVQLSAGGRGLAAAAVFPDVVIRSVLPQDTAGVQPQAARDVLGGTRVWWPWLLLLALVLLAVALVARWYRKRRPRQPVLPPAPAASPRDAALLALDRARASGALQAGDLKRFYSDISSALRGYLVALDPGLGTDLTSSELVLALRAAGHDGQITDLHRVLHAADLVKFARSRPAVGAAEADWARARGWVESWAATGSSARAA